MKPLPLGVRVAAGLAVSAVDRARHLPEKLAELPVTMVSQALQLSMRLQQQMTELAIKGDDALATFRPVEETPEWATFDEDGADDRYDVSPGPRSRFDAVGDEVDGAESGKDGAVVGDPWAEEERALRTELDAPHPDQPTEDAPEEDAPPAALPHYPDLTLPQLRARLRRLDVDQLAELLDYETAHANRPEFTGMLTRRIATLRDQR